MNYILLSTILLLSQAVRSDCIAAQALANLGLTPNSSIQHYTATSQPICNGLWVQFGYCVNYTNWDSIISKYLPQLATNQVNTNYNTANILASNSNPNNNVNTSDPNFVCVNTLRNLMNNLLCIAASGQGSDIFEFDNNFMVRSIKIDQNDLKNLYNNCTNQVMNDCNAQANLPENTASNNQSYSNNKQNNCNIYNACVNNNGSSSCLAAIADHVTNEFRQINRNVVNKFRNKFKSTKSTK